MELIIVSGPPCSGKTTFIKNNYNNYNIVSSDKEIFFIKEKNKELNNIELHKLAIESVCKKIENNIINNISTVYDGTNLTPEKREQILKICKQTEKNNTITIKGINILTDFNTIYKNWINRGKDIKIESLFFLFSIYRPIDKQEGFNLVENKITVNKNNYKYLEFFLENGEVDKYKLLEENKDLKFLNDFWEKSGRNYFKEYNQKLEYLEELSPEDKLAILYSDIKYFYQDFISNVEMVYTINYNDFLELFFINIMLPKIKILGLNKEQTNKSLIKIIDLF